MIYRCCIQSIYSRLKGQVPVISDARVRFFFCFFFFCFFFVFVLCKVSDLRNWTNIRLV